ncbi:MAG: YraN family protein [Pseudomonadota bacterium]
MPFDLAFDTPFDAVRQDKSLRGLTNYHDGIAAEDAVANHYSENGYRVVAKRWRGQAGEIDLICHGADGFVFVEVKKSNNFETAAAHLSFAQLGRIALAGEEYIGTQADDPLTPMRLDLAMVDGAGRIETLENLTLY